MTLPNRSILTFAGLGMLVACTATDQAASMPVAAPVAQVEVATPPALADIGANRFHIAPLPRMNEHSRGTVLKDRQNEVVCYFVVYANQPVLDCVKL